jgi:hypothetical protein
MSQISEAFTRVQWMTIADYMNDILHLDFRNAELSPEGRLNLKNQKQ